MEMSGRYVRCFSGGWFFSSLSEGLGQHSLGEKIRDFFKCAKIMDGLLRDKKGGTVLWKSKNWDHGKRRLSGAEAKSCCGPKPSAPGPHKPTLCCSMEYMARLLSKCLLLSVSVSAASLLFLLPASIFTLFPGHQESPGMVLIQAEIA